MAIHHSTKKKAESIGVILTEIGGENKSPFDMPNNYVQDGTAIVQAFWGQHNVYAFGAGEKPAAAAMEGIEAIQSIKERHPTCHIINDKDDPFLIRVFNDDRSTTLDREPLTPVDALMVDKEAKSWFPTTVPLDGGEAHKASFPITDNPYDEDDDADDFAAWDEAWEASADEADAEEASEPEVTGSVVSSRYRELYREQGHPNHSGDWLAVTLNNLVLGKTMTDLERFEAICAVNNVDTSKYKREGTGWQGRIRMTGRNLMAKQIFLQDGKMMLPDGMFPEIEAGYLQAPADWMAGQRFKAPKKAEPAAE